MDLFHKVNLDYNPDRLKAIYYNNYSMPPDTSYKEVMQTGRDQYLIAPFLNNKNILWGIEDYFYKKDLRIKESMVYISGPNTIGRPHLDACLINKVNEWAFNIPLFNGTSGRTIWYEHKEEDIITRKEKDNIVGYLSSKSAKECKEIASIVMTQPYIIRTNHLHTIENFTNNFRVTLTFRFKNKSWDQAKELLCQ